MDTRKKSSSASTGGTCRTPRAKAASPASPRAKTGAQPHAPDDSNPLARSSPAQLASLLQNHQAQAQWRPEDLAAILKHQLEQPIQPVMDQYLPGSNADALAEPAKRAHKIKTFGDLFRTKNPPADLLDVVRHYARDARVESDHSLPPVIAGALYWIAIAASVTTGGGHRSKLSRTDLEVGLKWLSTQKWVALPLRKMATQAAEKV